VVFNFSWTKVKFDRQPFLSVLLEVRVARWRISNCSKDIICAMSQVPLKATYTGFVYSTWDALVLFEACLSGRLNHVARRPHDRERSELIKSGNVFIYEENASGIKRWTDGVPWSPSRILGNFLVYRELERAFPPGEKKKALKKQRRPNPCGIAKTEARSPSTSDHVMAASLAASGAAGAAGSSPMASGNIQLDEKEADRDRYLIGSLIDSYPFKEKGLVKKTISISYRGVPHHLVSYYLAEDARQQLRTPSTDPNLAPMGIQIRPELLRQNFRVSLEQDETLFPHGLQDMHNPPHGSLPPGSMTIAAMHPHMHMCLPMPPPPMQVDMQRRVAMPSSSMAGAVQDHHNLDLVQPYPGQPWQTHPYDDGMSQQASMDSFANHQFGTAAGRPPHYASRNAPLPYAGEGDNRSMALAALNVGAYTGSVDHDPGGGGRPLDSIAGSSVGSGAGLDYSHQPVARSLGIVSQFPGQTGAGDLDHVVHPHPAHRQYQVDEGACPPLDGQSRDMYPRGPVWPQDSVVDGSRQTQDQGDGLDAEYHISHR